MGRSIVIPEEHLIEVHEVYDTKFVGNVKPRLKPMKYRTTSGLTPEMKAEFYYEEALGKLALARYWMEKSVSN